MSSGSRTFSRTRIAPTPSGFLHTGNLYSFLETAAIAKETGAAIFLRIDDLDRARVRQEYVQDIFDTLQFAGIAWEGPQNMEEYEAHFSQLHRMDLYREQLQCLREKNLLFACNCSRMQLANDKACSCRRKNISLDSPGVAWRLNTSAAKTLSMHTLRNGITQATLPASMQDFIVRKKDGFPAYQLTSVIDDLHFDIDLVVRGEDLWESTLAQLYLAECLELKTFLATVFHHHALLKDKEGRKLSKSAGDTSVRALRKQGKTPEEIMALFHANPSL